MPRYQRVLGFTPEQRPRAIVVCLLDSGFLKRQTLLLALLRHTPIGGLHARVARDIRTVTAGASVALLALGTGLASARYGKDGANFYVIVQPGTLLVVPRAGAAAVYDVALSSGVWAVATKGTPAASAAPVAAAEPPSFPAGVFLAIIAIALLVLGLLRALA